MAISFHGLRQSTTASAVVLLDLAGTRRRSALSAEKLDGEVFCDEVASHKEHYHVDLKLDFEVAGGQGWACEEPREEHVERDCEPLAHVTLTHLDVLDFGGCACA